MVLLMDPEENEVQNFYILCENVVAVSAFVRL